MSWGEVKKINSDASVPLNHLIWLNDYKTYGENSYVFRNKDIWNELLRNYFFVNDNSVYDDVLTLADSDKKLGYALSALYGSGLSDFERSMTDFETAIKTRSMVEAIANSTYVNDIYYSAAATNARNIISNNCDTESVIMDKIDNVLTDYHVKTINAEGKLIYIKRFRIDVYAQGGGIQTHLNCSIYGKTYSYSNSSATVGTHTADVNIPIFEPLDIKYKTNAKDANNMYVEYAILSD